MKKTALSSLNSGTTMVTVQPTSLNNGQTANSSNFAFSIWFYVNDWNYKYGDEKVIFGRNNNTNGKQPCPVVSLGRIQNDINIDMSVFGKHSSNAVSDFSNNYISGPQEVNSTSSTLTSSTSSTGVTGATGASSAGATGATGGANTSSVKTIVVHNVPIQAWVNLIISVYQRTLDVYLDGKLVQTNMLPNTADIDYNAPVYITPNGGFSGWTSKLQYFNKPLNPSEAWNIYRKGYGGSGTNFFDQYKLKFSVMNGTTQESSFEI
jgi:hypothetical protein